MNFETLGEVADVFNGKTPAKSEHREAGHPVLKIRDVDDAGRFRGKFGSFVDSSLATQFKKKQVLPGDTLILNAAHNADYVGSKSFLAAEDVRGALATGEWLLVRPIERLLDARFAHYWLTSPSARSAIRDQVKGIHLYPKDVARLSIPLPPLDEQERIAGILDKAEALLRKRKRALELLDGLTQSIFIDMFGDADHNHRRLPIMELNDFIESGPTNGLYKPSCDYGTGVPILRIGNFYDGKICEFKHLRRLRIDEDEISRFELRKNDIVINRVNSREYVGKVITHPCNRGVQAPMVLRMAPKGLLPVRRAVSTTVRMSASPAAAHIAR